MCVTYYLLKLTILLERHIQTTDIVNASIDKALDAYGYADSWTTCVAVFGPGAGDIERKCSAGFGRYTSFPQ